MLKLQMLICITAIVLFGNINAEICRTPGNLTGVCTGLNVCPVLLKMFRDDNSNPYIIKSACGLESVINIVLQIMS